MTTEVTGTPEGAIPAAISPHAQMWLDVAAGDLGIGKNRPETYDGILADLVPVGAAPAAAALPGCRVHAHGLGARAAKSKLRCRRPPGGDGRARPEHRQAEATIEVGGSPSGLPAGISIMPSKKATPT